MTQIDIEISEAQMAYINRQIAAGRFQTPDEFIAHLIKEAKDGADLVLREVASKQTEGERQ